MTDLAGKKILVVEDNAQARDFLEQFLIEENYIFKIAKDGEEGLKQFDLFQPDLVILDLMLPVLDGLEVLKSLKKRAPDVKVVMTTGISDPMVIDECIAEGARTYIVKPLNLESLEVVIKKFFD
jgi:DNA-binding response OmpR family regulator